MAGRSVRPPAPVAVVENIPAAEPPAQATKEPPAQAAGEPPAAEPEPAARAVDPQLAPQEAGGLERAPPRAAMSQLSLALPAPPKPPAQWKGTRLYQPVATAAGLIDAKGYSIAIAGVTATPADRTCDYQGRQWPCGARARAAFRAWLRGRAVTCVVPPEPDRSAIAAECGIGKQDVGEWLVANGWTEAAAGGPYADLGATVQKAQKGIFGPPPVSEAPALSPAGSALPAPQATTGDIMAPTPEAQAPPLLDGPFPPAPKPAPPSAPAQ